MTGIKSLLARWRARRRMRVCEETHARIQEIVDGEVPDERAQRTLERHIDDCLPCEAEANTVRELKSALARVGSRPDPVVKQRIESLLDQIRCGEVAAGEDSGTDADR